MIVSVVCKVANQVNSFDPSVWVPAIISIISLFLNIVFFIYVAPYITSRNQKKEKMYEIACEFMELLSAITSKEDYSGIPTEIRKYCLKIHMMFKSGSAPKDIGDQMETIFQLAQKRKKITLDQDLHDWQVEFRQQVKLLRKSLSKYTGFFRN
jgi:hypothetical protein